MRPAVANPPEPLDPSFQLSLPDFEGPLDLLLHLIRRHELDILDLPVAFVTERYLEYVSLMKQLNLDVASEYLVMAATLAHIKSKLLLPEEPKDQDDELLEETLDPRAELIRRLLEYQKYKAAAESLGGREVAGRDVFPRGSEAPKASGPAPLASPSLFQLLDAFQRVLTRVRGKTAFEVETDGVSIQERMGQLTLRLQAGGELSFDALFEGQAKLYDLVVTFLAILEMAKRRLLQVSQDDAIGPIRVRSAVLSAEADDDAATDRGDRDEAPADDPAEAASAEDGDTLDE